VEILAKSIAFKDKLNIIPLSDLHLGARSCSERKLDSLLNWVLNKEDTYTIILGDIVDAITRQDLKRFTEHTIKSELLTQLDSLLNAQRDLAVKKLRPLADAGKIISIGMGNHEYSIAKHYSFNITKDICQELNVNYGGYSSFTRLTVKKRGRDAKKNVIILCHHGWGASRRSGGALNKRENLLLYFNADIILLGHDHQKFAKRLIRLDITRRNTPKLVHKPVIIAATGSFQKTYSEGEITYAERMGFQPSDLGVVKITIDIKGEDKTLDLHCSE
jgi:predicted MPP superfamily phosphohydrolase